MNFAAFFCWRFHADSRKLFQVLRTSGHRCSLCHFNDLAQVFVPYDPDSNSFYVDSYSDRAFKGLSYAYVILFSSKCFAGINLVS